MLCYTCLSVTMMLLHNCLGIHLHPRAHMVPTYPKVVGIRGRGQTGFSGSAELPYLPNDALGEIISIK